MDFRSSSVMYVQSTNKRTITVEVPNEESLSARESVLLDGEEKPEDKSVEAFSLPMDNHLAPCLLAADKEYTSSVVGRWDFETDRRPSQGFQL